MALFKLKGSANQKVIWLNSDNAIYEPQTNIYFSFLEK